jgi:hypothetical protein
VSSYNQAPRRQVLSLLKRAILSSHSNIITQVILPFSNSNYQIRARLLPKLNNLGQEGQIFLKRLVASKTISFPLLKPTQVLPLLLKVSLTWTISVREAMPSLIF